MSVLVLVEKGQHPRIGIGANFQFSQMHLATGLDLDVGRREIEAAGRHQQRKRRIGLIEIAEHQGFGADGAIDIRRHVEMADGRRDLAQRIDHAGIDTHRRIRRRLVATGHFDCIPFHIVGQIVIRPATRLAKDEQHGQGDIARLSQRRGQAAIGIELLLGLEQHRFDLWTGRGDTCGRQRSLRRGQSGRRRDGGRRGQGHAAGRHQTLDIDEPGIALRFGIEHRGGDHLGLGRGKFFDHLRHDFARPGPAADVVDALFVDGDHRHLVGRRARGGRDPQVIGLALEPLQQFAIAENQNDDADDHPEKDIALPEIRLLHSLTAPWQASETSGWVQFLQSGINSVNHFHDIWCKSTAERRSSGIKKPPRS